MENHVRVIGILNLAWGLMGLMACIHVSFEGFLACFLPRLDPWPRLRPLAFWAFL